MARSVITRIKELSTVWTLLGWLVVAAGSGVVFNAIAGHNDNEKAHPAMQQLILANTASIELLSQKADLIQEANAVKFEQIDEKQDRMILLLDNLTVKVDAL